MIKSYKLSNGTHFETITIPKGTVLFRGLVLEEGMPDERIFSDMLGYSGDEGLTISPTQNVFFYPAPYVSQVVDQFNIHAIYITNYELELLLLIKPSEHHRGTRHNETSPIKELITTCTNISEKDKCGIDMKSNDACFTDKIIKEYENIKGYIAIANTDSGKIINQLKQLYERYNIDKLHQIMPSISSNSRDKIGIPEIVLHPLHLRRPICEVVRKRMWLNEHYIQYCINNRAKFNYFPLLYITENNIYTFDKLRPNNVIKSMKTELKGSYIIPGIFNKIESLLDRFLSPEGYKINKSIFKFTVDLRTGFYVAKIAPTTIRKKYTLKNNENTVDNTHMYFYNIYNINESHTNDYKNIIPVSFPRREKYRIMNLIGRHLHTNIGKKYMFLDDIENTLNLDNFSLTSYVLNKGDDKKYNIIYKIYKAFDRPDLYKNKNPVIENNQITLRNIQYENFINKPNKTRKMRANLNQMNLENIYMIPLDTIN